MSFGGLKTGAKEKNKNIKSMKTSLNIDHSNKSMNNQIRLSHNKLNFKVYT
jgi:hypothetical protein